MNDGIVDLRSDTVTRPAAGMRRAMAEAEVDDDVLGKDPTVDRLEVRDFELRFDQDQDSRVDIERLRLDAFQAGRPAPEP